MFVYCTERLRLSEAEAYLRIAAARASREHPVLLAMLADGRLHLSAIARLAPHLTVANRDAVLQRATHRSKREIEELVAELSPRPDALAWIRKLPERRDALATATPQPPAPATSAAAMPLALSMPPAALGAPSAPLPSALVPPCVPETQLVSDRVAAARPAVLEPLSPARYRVQFTASASLREKLERLQWLMRSSVPDGDLAAIVEAAVTEKVQRLEARRFADTPRPRATLAESDTGGSSSRHIPAAVKRIVRRRDGDRCRYVDAQGRRCTARERLEFHHRHPYGHGGNRAPDNIKLLCHAHNAYIAEADYGVRPATPSAGARAGRIPRRPTRPCSSEWTTALPSR